MSAPANTGRVINYVTKRKSTVDNKTLINQAGGTDAQWGEYLSGYRVLCIVRAVNQIMKEDNKAFVSEGVGSEQWQLVTVAEFHRRKAQYELEHADNSYKNAYQNMQAIVDDTRAPKRLRNNAIAWLELFKEPQTEKSRGILKEFAGELAKKSEKDRTVLKLVEQKA